MGDAMDGTDHGLSEHGFRVVRSDRAVGGIRAGDEVVLLPVESVLADAGLLRLPTVRRMAQRGRRGVILVPLEEWRTEFAR